ncbi:unnamed protein product, partial [Ectocarpus sp. 13 AM-2016]
MRVVRTRTTPPEERRGQGAVQWRIPTTTTAMQRVSPTKRGESMKAAELGKMLLDEKEAAAEAHEGEKEALWRRIQDMARRVMELEQEAAESRDEFSLQQDEHARRLALAGAQRGGGGGVNSSWRVSHGGGGDRVEERALRAKNEMLERQLAHMREEAEETQLELAAARKKARFSTWSSRRLTRGRSDSLQSSPALSARLERGDGSLYGGGGGAAPPRPLSPAGSSFSPSRLPEMVAAVSGGGGGGSVAGAPFTPGNGEQEHHHYRREEEEEEENDADGAESEVSNDELRAADRVHASALRARIEEAGESDGDGGAGGREPDDDDGDDDDEQDVAWLLEQNTWLMQELEAKDDFIQALREQVEQLQRRGGHGPGPSSSMQSLRELGGSDDSDDDSDQEGGQRSFLDHLLHGTGGGGSNGQRPVDDHHEPAQPSVPTTVVSRNEGHPTVVTTNDDAAAAPGLGDGCAAAAALEAAAPRGRRSFGGVLTGNAMQDADKTAQYSSRSSRRQSMQSKSPVRGGIDGDGENSPFHGGRGQQANKHPHQGAVPSAFFLGSAEQQKQLQQPLKRSLSPTRSDRRQSAGGVTGIVGYAAAAAAAEVAGATTTTAAASSTTRAGAMATVPPLPETEEATTAATTAKAKPPTPAPPVATPPTVEEETAKATGRQKATAKFKAKQQAEETVAAAAAAAAAAVEPAAHEAVPPLAHMNRAERKSRQAVEKLGLRAVKGVFRMTMRTTNGVVFVVKAPDVFRHPRQETYVVFGSAETDGSGSEVRASRAPQSFVPPPIAVGAPPKVRVPPSAVFS